MGERSLNLIQTLAPFLSHLSLFQAVSYKLSLRPIKGYRIHEHLGQNKQKGPTLEALSLPANDYKDELFGCSVLLENSCGKDNWSVRLKDSTKQFTEGSAWRMRCTQRAEEIELKG